jgi:hypothetical protein
MSSDEYKQIVSMFSDNAKTYTQVAIAALLLPITFIRQVIGVPPTEAIGPHLNWVLKSSWLLLLIAIASGLLYQYIAVKLIEGHFAHSKQFYGILGCLIKRPDKVYAVMMLAFYLGACFFVAAAMQRFSFL